MARAWPYVTPHLMQIPNYESLFLTFLFNELFMVASRRPDFSLHNSSILLIRNSQTLYDLGNRPDNCLLFLFETLNYIMSVKNVTNTKNKYDRYWLSRQLLYVQSTKR